MAFTERYVTHDAGGGGVGSEGDPWTFAEALTNNAPGERANMKAGAYSLGADAVTNAGTIFDRNVFRGYNSAIGDLENPGRSLTTGKLITTGFPAITLTGSLTPNVFSIFQSLTFTGALSSFLVGSASVDTFGFVECEAINTQNNSAAKAVQGDNDCFAVNSDFECTGAAHGTVCDFDVDLSAIACRIKSMAANGAEYNSGGDFLLNLMIGGGSGTAFQQNGSRGVPLLIALNTIYNWGTAIEFSNNAPSINTPIIFGNHPTDCAKYIDDLYVATDSTPVIEVNNRTRDNTTPRTGVGDGVNSGEVTTDTGGPETDYTNAGADNFSLISGAPGEGAGAGFGEPDIGAWVHAVAAAGGGGTKLIGFGGGMIG